MKTILETLTPLGPDIDEFVTRLAGSNDADAILLGESGGVSAITAAERLRQSCEKDIILKIACRDRNRIALRSQIVTAAASGFTKLLVVDGAHPNRTPFSNAKPVYELDSLGLLRMIKRGSPEFGEGIDAAPAAFMIAACIGGSTAADMTRAKKFLEADADMLFTYSLESVSRLRRLTEKPIFLSIVEGEAADPAEIRQKAEAAGADGINLIVDTLDKAPDGTTAAG